MKFSYGNFPKLKCETGLRCAAWYFLITDEPAAHRCISREEADFIMANRSAHQPGRSSGGSALSLRSLRTVTAALLASPAVLVNMACFFANDWGIYTLLTEGPNFLSTGTPFN